MSSYPPPSSIPASPGSNGGSVGGAAPSYATMALAQQEARHAVSALQFFDHTTARKHILAALQKIDTPGP